MLEDTQSFDLCALALLILREFIFYVDCKGLKVD